MLIYNQDTNSFPLILSLSEYAAVRSKIFEELSISALFKDNDYKLTYITLRNFL